MATPERRLLLDDRAYARTLHRMALDILQQTPDVGRLVLVGIQRRGVELAARLARFLADESGSDVPRGALDITLYRDDLNAPHGGIQPFVRTTEIGFDIDSKTIILVDDVLYTGRSTRAAMDALMDLGRPKAIRLAVLVDRAGRELPIQADYAGYEAQVGPGQSVQVNFVESDGKDEVTVA